MEDGMGQDIQYDGWMEKVWKLDRVHVVSWHEVGWPISEWIVLTWAPMGYLRVSWAFHVHRLDCTVTTGPICGGFILGLFGKMVFGKLVSI